MIRFDYEKQAYIVNGRYVSCGHPAAGTEFPWGGVFEGCECYGRIHAGELAENEGENNA
jgi:hypothetical protein